MIKNAAEIIEHADLVEVISRVAGVKFARSGSSMKGLSPFANENTPSFYVSPARGERGIYKCFSTGIGGSNAAGFIMDYRNCTYPEAIIELADITGDPVIYESGDRSSIIKAAKDQRDNKEKLIHAIKKAHDFYNSTNVPVPTELGTIDVAGKSYSPALWSKWGLALTAASNQLTTASNTWSERQQLIDAGILAESKQGSGYYDFFHSRVLFPLYDQMGRMIGFNGRTTIADKAKVKYLNSKDSICYNKSSHLYGYFQNMRNIMSKELAYLVEGPTDVITMDAHGLNNVVCASGTAFTRHHATLLAQATPMVILCLDGDRAGQDATIKAVRTIMEQQLEVKVKLIPDGEDPASYLAKYGADAFIKIPVIDGIEYVIRTYMKDDKMSHHDKAAAFIHVCDLISLIRDEMLRTSYMQTYAKQLDATVTFIKSHVKDIINDRIEGKTKLSKDQEAQKVQYGLYIDDNRYYDYNSVEISNFIIKPLFLVSYPGSATRIFEIVNKYGHSKIINLNSDDFITMMGFRRATEMLGNFVFKGNDSQYIKIREWIYNDMAEVKPIEVLGYQPSTGVYAWANGITLPGTSQVVEADEYGIVPYEDQNTGAQIRYFLPGESKVNIKDDEDTDRELETNFRWITPPSGSKAPRDLKGWADGFSKVFGGNAAIALCWIFASVHRDILHKRYDMYPHLNLFGPAGSGKTFMAKIITAIFGKPMRAVHLVSSSHVAFYRKIAQSRNSIVWYEEYSEKVAPEKQEALKNFADGFGRITGQMTNNNKTKASPVLNACIISGQILPSHDPALLERCITLFFDKYYGDKKSQNYAEAFKSWSNEGIFAYVAAEIFSYRAHIESNFAERMEDVRDTIRQLFSKSNAPGDRVLNNFAMVATVYILISEKVKLPFTTAQIIDTIAERITEQGKAVEGADELSGFWMVIEYLITKGKEVPGQGLTADHYAVEMHRQLLVKVNENKTEQITFDQDTKCMFIRLNHAHSLYTREGKSMVSRVVEKGTLLHYMRQHRSYIGEMKAKRINDKVQRCLVFNLDHLPQFEFDITGFKVKDQPPMEASPTGGEMTFNAPKDGELPF